MLISYGHQLWSTCNTKWYLNWMFKKGLLAHRLLCFLIWARKWQSLTKYTILISMYFCSVLSDSLWGKCYISVKYQGSEIYLIVSVCVGSILIGGTFVCVMTLLLIAKNGGDPFQYLVIVVDPRAFAATALALVGKQATQRYEGYTFFTPVRQCCTYSMKFCPSAICVPVSNITSSIWWSIVVWAHGELTVLVTALVKAK